MGASGALATSSLACCVFASWDLFLHPPAVAVWHHTQLAHASTGHAVWSLLIAG
jgi:hypothetical protein